MKKYLVLVLSVLTATLFIGCGAAQSNTATIELAGHEATGYSWVYEMTVEGIVRELSNEYVRNSDGAGGMFVFTFEAVGDGESELLFSYLRPWEEEEPPVETAIYRAVVSGGKLTFTEQ